jgi:hypothetical protein
VSRHVPFTDPGINVVFAYAEVLGDLYPPTTSDLTWHGVPSKVVFDDVRTDYARSKFE